MFAGDEMPHHLEIQMRKKNNKRAFFGKKSVSGAMRSEMEENKKKRSHQ